MAEELKLLQKTYDMIQYGYICLRQYPKSEKHTLAAETKRAMFGLLKAIIMANRRYYKKNAIQEADVQFGEEAKMPPDPGWELEQRFFCGGFCSEPEQRPLGLERLPRDPLRLCKPIVNNTTPEQGVFFMPCSLFLLECKGGDVHARRRTGTVWCCNICNSWSSLRDDKVF